MYFWYTSFCNDSSWPGSTSLSSRAHEREGAGEDAVENGVGQVQLLGARLPLPPGNHPGDPARTPGPGGGAGLSLVEPVALLVVT